MALSILLTIMVTSLIQSIFGVGVLLFGTPILLALGYDFMTVITILLPISLTINVFQVVKDYRKVDTDFYRKILLYTIPFIVLFLFIVTISSINIGMVVGAFLLIVAIKEYSVRLKSAIDSLTRHERLYLVVMGIIHGITNLGGSLLTVIIHNKNYQKDVTRATVAACYATFAAFQIATLMFSANRPTINFIEHGLYLMAGIMTFILTETTVYLAIDSRRYSRYFAMFLFGSGVLLCFKSNWNLW